MVQKANRLVWDEIGKRDYQSGVDRGVLYLQDNKGVYGNGEAWPGLTKVSESPEGGSVEAKYANNQIYLNLISAEKFKGTIGAYSYPTSFEKCDGTIEFEEAPGVKATAQVRSRFGFTYRTAHGTDTEGIGSSYEIHIVYNATASVSSKERTTINDTPEAVEFSWEFNTIPVDVPGMKNPTAHLIIDTSKLTPSTLEELEDTLYGGSAKAKLPTPEELIAILKKSKTPGA